MNNILLIGNKKTNFCLYLAELLCMTGKKSAVIDKTNNELFAAATSYDGEGDRYYWKDVLVLRSDTEKIDDVDVCITIADKRDGIESKDFDFVFVVSDISLRGLSVLSKAWADILNTYSSEKRPVADDFAEKPDGDASEKPKAKTKGLFGKKKKEAAQETKSETETEKEEEEKEVLERQKLVLIFSDYNELRYTQKALIQRLGVTTPLVFTIERNDSDILSDMDLEIDDVCRFAYMSAKRKAVFQRICMNIVGDCDKEQLKVALKSRKGR